MIFLGMRPIYDMPPYYEVPKVARWWNNYVMGGKINTFFFHLIIFFFYHQVPLGAPYLTRIVTLWLGDLEVQVQH